MTQPSQFDPALVEASAKAGYYKSAEFAGSPMTPNAWEHEHPETRSIWRAIVLAVLSAREKWERENPKPPSGEKP